MKQKLILFATALSLSFLTTSNVSAQWVQTTAPLDAFLFAAIGTNLFAGGSGVILSTNDGASWTAVNNGLTNEDIRSIVSMGSHLFVGTTGGGVFLSTDSGKNWEAEGNGLPSYPEITALAVKGTSLFAATESPWRGNPSYDSIYLSTDNGLIWSPVVTPYSDSLPSFSNEHKSAIPVNCLAVVGANLFAGFGATALKGVGGAFISTKNGASWSEAGLDSIPVLSFAVIGSNLFAGTDSGVFLTTNNGISWISGLTNPNLSALAVNGTNLFAGGGSGPFLSTDNGINWQEVDSGLPPPIPYGTYIDELVTNGTYLFAAISGTGYSSGIWRRPLSDFSISSVTPTPPSPPQIQSYPNPFTHSTTVTFSSQNAGFPEVTVVNLLGAQVAELFSGELSAGEHSFTWDAGKDACTTGMYECVVRMNGQVQRVSMILSN